MCMRLLLQQSMAKPKIPKTPQQRSVIFTKRRKGLFKKAAELCMFCDAQLAIIVTSPSSKQKLYSFAHSSLHSILDVFLNGCVPQPADARVVRSATFLSQEIKTLEAGLISDAAAKKKKKQNQLGPVPKGFPLDLEYFDRSESVDELQRLVNRLQKLKDKAMNKLSDHNDVSSAVASNGELGSANHNYNGNDDYNVYPTNLPMSLFKPTSSSSVGGWLNSTAHERGFGDEDLRSAGMMEGNFYGVQGVGPVEINCNNGAVLLNPSPYCVDSVTHDWQASEVAQPANKLFFSALELFI